VGGSISTYGDIKLDVRIGEKIFAIWFCVVYDQEGFLLGNNFLIFADACIKPRTKTMVMNIDDEEFSIPLMMR
jgi:hypothetical protein